MNNLFVLLFIHLVIICQDSENPNQLNFVSGEKFEFYNQIEFAYYNEKHFIYDIGNAKFKIINKFNHLIQTFGNKGNGPFEFDNYGKVFVNDSRIFLVMLYKIMVFDHEGKGIKEVYMNIGDS